MLAFSESIQYLASHLWALITVVVILGLLIGSFLNVVILRLPIMLMRQFKAEYQAASYPEHSALTDLTRPYNLIKPDSHCPHCQAPVRAWHNIPVLSFLLLRGRCAHCAHRIGWRYPVVELSCALISALVVWQSEFGWPLLALLVFSWVLLALAVIDIDHQLLPDSLTLGLLWLGLMVNSFELFTTLKDAVYGAVLGYGLLWSVFWLFKLFTGKEGMGYGDFKLLAALGAWLGVSSIPLIVLLSSVVGATVGIVGMLVLGRDKNIPIPFGPYLACAGLIAALWGPSLIALYLGY